MPRESLASLRKRAFELADTGLLANWTDVAHEMEAEGRYGATERLSDIALIRQINARCKTAKQRRSDEGRPEA